MAKKAKTATKKAANTTAATRKPGKGTRYSNAERAKIIAFVEEVNSAKGRGGVAAAARKFGASPLSIGNWIRKGGAGAAAPKLGRPASSGSASKGSGRDRVLNELTSLNRDIAKKRGELEALEARFSKLKAAL